MSSHPNEQPQALPGSICAVTTYFNPAGYGNKIYNYHIFRQRLKSQGIPLLAIEAELDTAPFELRKDDAEILVQCRCHCVLWQKERLFNLALEHLPAGCDKVVFLDADIIITDEQWVGKTAQLLQGFIAVQPFINAYQLPPYAPGPKGTLILSGQSSSSTWVHCDSPDTYTMKGHPGYAMAVRRSFMETHRFYEREVVGCGDSAFFGALVGIPPSRNSFLHLHTPVLLRHMDEWAAPVSRDARGSVTFLPADLHHLWHGDRSKRYYVERMLLLAGYDPKEDVSIGAGGCLEWATKKHELHARVKQYFIARDEEDAQPETLERRRIRMLTDSLDYEALRARTFLAQKLETEQAAHALRLEVERLRSVEHECRSMQKTLVYRLVRRLNICSLFLLPSGSQRRAYVTALLRKLAGSTQASSHQAPRPYHGSSGLAS